MKRLLLVLAFFAAAVCAPHAHAQTPQNWYVRADGGTRYSANKTTGQCDGKHDAAYPGTGVNQKCAFNDFRFFYDDQSYGGINAGWVIAGGDRIIIRGCVPEADNNFTNQCRIGFEKPANSGGGYLWCVGNSNGSGGCINPTIPSGTATQHTQILGQNYAACSNGNAPDHSKLTYLFGGYGAWDTLNLSGAHYVDVQCLEITSHASCMWAGSPPNPRYCSSGTDDYDSDGISTDTGTSEVYLQDLWIHGHTGRGIKGPIGAGVVQGLRLEIGVNGQAGWDFDDGHSTPMGPGATWRFLQSSISFSGCNQVWPETRPVSCYDQSSGGYGDGVGTPAGTCLNVVVDHSSFNYNTQDGLDLGHIDTGSCSLLITGSTAIGNMGGTFKWGPNENPAVFVNNSVNANCARMSAELTGTVTGYNQYLSLWCRAGDGMSFNFRQGGVATITNNTYTGYAQTSWDIACWDAACDKSTLNFQNNMTIGYDNPFMYNKGGQAGGVGGIFFQQTIGNINRLNNLWFGMRPSSFDCTTLPASEKCADPLLVNEPAGQAAAFTETELDSFNYMPTSASPAVKGGVSNSSTPATDQAGSAETTPATIGPLVAGGIPPAPIPTPTPTPTPAPALFTIKTVKVTGTFKVTAP